MRRDQRFNLRHSFSPSTHTSKLILECIYLSPPCLTTSSTECVVAGGGQGLFPLLPSPGSGTSSCKQALLRTIRLPPQPRNPSRDIAANTAAHRASADFYRRAPPKAIFYPGPVAGVQVPRTGHLRPSVPPSAFRILCPVRKANICAVLFKEDHITDSKLSTGS